MAKYKVGQIVQHISTGEHLLVLHVKEEASFNRPITPEYVCRLPNYDKAVLQEFELTGVKTSNKIEDEAGLL